MSLPLSTFQRRATQFGVNGWENQLRLVWKPLLPLLIETIHYWTFCIATIRSKINPLPSRANIGTAT